MGVICSLREYDHSLNILGNHLYAVNMTIDVGLINIQIVKNVKNEKREKI